MTVANYFYNQTTRKYIALFGMNFYKLSIIRKRQQTGDPVQQFIVPISYGPYQKFLARLTQDPNLDRKTAIALPRMSFEISNLVYDGDRKVNTVKKIKTNQIDSTSDFIYAPTPYNIEFTLWIMTKYEDDGTQIVEQILPFFKPEWTTTVALMDGVEPFDVPLILNSVGMEDVYEGDFETRRSIVWTLSFTMKAWYFGPVKNKKVIKFVDARIFDHLPTPTDMDPSTLGDMRVTVQPGLTANGQPTTDITETIPYLDIDVGDNWGVVTIIEESGDA